MKGHLRIDTLIAFVVLDDDGTEGIPAFVSDGQMWPMVGTDRGRIEQFIPLANALGKPYRILEFTTRTDVTDQYPAVYQVQRG